MNGVNPEMAQIELQSKKEDNTAKKEVSNKEKNVNMIGSTKGKDSEDPWYTTPEINSELRAAALHENEEMLA